jgi:hypothetical protein
MEILINLSSSFRKLFHGNKTTSDRQQFEAVGFQCFETGSHSDLSVRIEIAKVSSLLEGCDDWRIHWHRHGLQSS